MRHGHVVAIGGHKSTGEPVLEELVVEAKDDSYVLLASPAILLGMAAGDTIQVDALGNASVQHRGGNLAIQVYGDPAAADALVRILAGTDARVDSRVPKLTVVTAPVRVGFSRIESALAEMLNLYPETEWYYGNVYEEDGTTPLNWW
jgi:acetyl-CoA carboxylase carboxyltransferase component